MATERTVPSCRVPSFSAIHFAAQLIPFLAEHFERMLCIWDSAFDRAIIEARAPGRGHPGNCGAIDRTGDCRLIDEVSIRVAETSGVAALFSLRGRRGLGFRSDHSEVDVELFLIGG